MKFGFCIMADIDEIGFFPFIEGLGYNSAWVADSQMMYSDVYVVCAWLRGRRSDCASGLARRSAALAFRRCR